jgi:MFS family permease
MSSGRTTSDAVGPFVPPHAARNYVLTVMNGAMGYLADSFVNPQLILAGFLYLLTKSTAMVGLLMIIDTAGQMWPQLFVSRYIEHWPRKLPTYIAATGVRVAGLLTLLASMVFMAAWGTSPWMLYLFFIGRLIHRSGEGCANVVFLDIIGQSIDEKRRGRLFASRGFYGDALAMAAGPLLVQPILKHYPAPSNYLLLSTIGVSVWIVGWSIFSFIRERPKENPLPERTLKEVLVDGMELLRSDLMYRRLLVYRVLVRVATLTLVFYVPFGTDRLGAAEMGGVFVGLLGASRLISAPVWGRLCDRLGSRFCLTGASVCYILAPMLALLAAHLPHGFTLALPLHLAPLTLPLAVFLLALVMFGLGQRADFIADSSFLLDHAPAERRCSYQAFLAMVTFPMTFLPGLAGYLADQPWCGLEPLFIAIAVICVGMLLASLRLWVAGGPPGPLAAAGAEGKRLPSDSSIAGK